jgi:hypothetical protein
VVVAWHYSPSVTYLVADVLVLLSHRADLLAPSEPVVDTAFEGSGSGRAGACLDAPTV